MKILLISLLALVAGIFFWSLGSNDLSDDSLNSWDSFSKSAEQKRAANEYSSNFKSGNGIEVSKGISELEALNADKLLEERQMLHGIRDEAWKSSEEISEMMFRLSRESLYSELKSGKPESLSVLGEISKSASLLAARHDIIRKDLIRFGKSCDETLSECYRDAAADAEQISKAFASVADFANHVKNMGKGAAFESVVSSKYASLGIQMKRLNAQKKRFYGENP